MQLHVVLPEPKTFSLRYEDKPSDKSYVEFCEANPEVRVERTAEGEIVIMPPAGFESDYRGSELVAQLGNWAKKDGHGKVFGSSAQFFLPDGAIPGRGLGFE